MSNMYVPDARNYRLTGSVGAGGRNAPEDVRVVQQVLANCGLYKGRIDTHCGIKTEAAIREYQNFMQKPDGRVDVDGRTWQYMTGRFRRPSTPAPKPQLNPAPAAGGIVSDAPSGDGPYFPFAVPPASISWRPGTAGEFGHRRGNGARSHAGCDIYQNAGVPVYAIKAGKVLRVGRAFTLDNSIYNKTWVVDIDHGDYAIRYGEVAPGSTTVEAGDTVRAGQMIAKVGVALKNGPTMLHLEQYADASSTVAYLQDIGKYINNRPSRRRADVMNPTPLLDALLPHLAPGE